MTRSISDQPTKQTKPSSDGQRTWPFRLEAPRRRIQVPQLLIAVFLVVFGALVAVVLFSRAAASEPVLALANPLARGEVIAADDLMTVYVASDDPIATLPSEDASSLVGSSSVTDLDEGTILTSAHLASRQILVEGEGVVGLALSPGRYPTLSLAPGDQVDVVVTGQAGEAGTATGRVIATAEVFDVAELGAQGDRFVSLRMAADSTTEIAAAAEAGQIRLVLVAGSGG